MSSGKLKEVLNKKEENTQQPIILLLYTAQQTAEILHTY